MRPNVGSLDRTFRTALGFGLLYLALLSGWPAMDGGLLRFAAMAIGVVMLIVAATRVCPIYSILGVKTCKA